MGQSYRSQLGLTARQLHQQRCSSTKVAVQDLVLLIGPKRARLLLRLGCACQSAGPAVLVGRKRDSVPVGPPPGPVGGPVATEALPVGAGATPV